MKKLPNFKQDNIRAWIWLFIILIHFVGGIYALAMGAYSAAFLNGFIAGGVFWIDQLEKELTRRNIEDEQRDKRESLQ